MMHGSTVTYRSVSLNMDGGWVAKILSIATSSAWRVPQRERFVSLRPLAIMHESRTKTQPTETSLLWRAEVASCRADCMYAWLMVGGGAVGLRGSFSGVVVASTEVLDFGGVAGMAGMAGMGTAIGTAVRIAIFGENVWIRRFRDIFIHPFVVQKCLFGLLAKKRSGREGGMGSLVGEVFRLSIRRGWLLAFRIIHFQSPLKLTFRQREKTIIAKK